MRFLARDAYRIVVVSIFILSACSRAPHAMPAEAKDSHVPATSAAVPTLLLLGTSLTAGYGLDPADAWSAHLQHKVDSSGLAFHVVNAGVSGETSADALHRIDWLLSQGTPAVIVLETGANDALRGQPLDSIAANVNAIVARLDSLRPHPVIVVAGMEALPNLGRAYGAEFSRYLPGRRHGASCRLPPVPPRRGRRCRVVEPGGWNPSEPGRITPRGGQRVARIAPHSRLGSGGAWQSLTRSTSEPHGWSRILGVVIVISMFPYASGIARRSGPLRRGGAACISECSGASRSGRCRAIIIIVIVVVGLVLPMVWLVTLLVGQAQSAASTILNSSLLQRIGTLQIGGYAVGPAAQAGGIGGGLVSGRQRVHADRNRRTRHHQPAAHAVRPVLPADGSGRARGDSCARSSRSRMRASPPWATDSRP